MEEEIRKEAAMISISLCMIVKNEESILDRGLSSIYDLMDEIIIVDTGSTDRTKEIASKYTDKVYDFVWEDDFSKARNFSFSKATKDYIYVADADEVLDRKNHEKFRLLKEALLPEIDIVQMYYTNQLENGTTYNYDKEYRGKLYKRVRNFMWIDPIHETINLYPTVFDSEIEIQHKPSCNHAKRDFTMFYKIYERGERLSAKVLTMYAKELFIVGEDRDFLQAESIFLDLLQDTSRGEEELKDILCVLTKLYRIKKDVHSLLKCSLKVIAIGSVSEVCYEVGEYFYEQEDYLEAVVWYYNAVYETTSLLNIHYSGDLPLRRLSECFRLLGDNKNQVEYRKFADRWCKDHSR